MMQELSFDAPAAPVHSAEVNGHAMAESFETAVPAQVSRETAGFALPTQLSRSGNSSAPQAGRPKPPPHSPEAESHLLSCLLMEPAEVLPKCEESHLAPDSFFDPKRAAIFAAILDTWRATGSVDIASLAQTLQKLGKLAYVGGWAFLTEASQSVPTTIQVTSLIATVVRDHRRRRLIRQATELIEAAETGDPTEVAKDAAKRLHECASGADHESEIASRAFDHTRLLARPDPIYTVNGTAICTPGNLTAIYSQAKTGKSSFLAAMIASTMTNPNSPHDCLGVGGPNYQNRAVLHFDTEQAPYDWQQLVLSALRRVNEPRCPPWLKSFTIAGMEAQKAEAFIHRTIRLMARRHGGIHSIFIDGIADLVNDPNSADECFPLLARLHASAIEHSTAIINILHLNPAAKDKADKGRGHLGSQLERKCESNLLLKKEGDITTVCADGRQRHAPIPTDKAPSFSWSDEHQMHRTCAAPTSDAAPGTRGGRPSKYDFDDYRNIFPPRSGPGLPLAELHRLMSANRPLPKDNLHNTLKRWADQGMVEILTPQGQPKRYRLAV